jgi:hypothetical protein
LTVSSPVRAISSRNDESSEATRPPERWRKSAGTSSTQSSQRSMSNDGSKTTGGRPQRAGSVSRQIACRKFT